MQIINPILNTDVLFRVDRLGAIIGDNKNFILISRGRDTSLNKVLIKISPI